MNKKRDKFLSQLSQQTFDVLIVGGGINGAVSAASLSARGLKVALIDKQDFASQCSSNSSNLIWGGIKYLESYEFMLVNKLCKSRNQLMKFFPTTIREIRFLTTIQKGFRLPAWMLYCGSLLYWVMGRFATRRPEYLSAKNIEARESIINTEYSQGGLEYSDAYLPDNDARFVFQFIQKAITHGAITVNYVESLKANRAEGFWHCQAKDNQTQETIAIKTKAIINACGPSVDDFNQRIHQTTYHKHLFSKGIHLIVNRLTDIEKVLAFFASDGRLFFVLPMGERTCIGTTDTRVAEPEVEVSDEDREFVLKNINQLLDLSKPLTQDDIISERCGVRPLVVKDDSGIGAWAKLSRKHIIEVNKKDQCLSIFGGKLTDCVNIGEEIAQHLKKCGLSVNPLVSRWYGEPENEMQLAFFQKAAELSLDKLTHKDSIEPLSQRYWRMYGEGAFSLLESIQKQSDKANIAIKDSALTWAEVDWMADNEFIVELEDMFRRRSKVALMINKNDLINSDSLRAIAERLFGEQADEKLNNFSLG